MPTVTYRQVSATRTGAIIPALIYRQVSKLKSPRSRHLSIAQSFLPYLKTIEVVEEGFIPADIPTPPDPILPKTSRVHSIGANHFRIPAVSGAA